MTSTPTSSTTSFGARPRRPSQDQVSELPALLEGQVLPAWIDVNGHMNIRYYLDTCAGSADLVCRDVGIDDDYRADRRLGVFTAEHHIRYTGELHEGEQFSVHARVVDVSQKGAHLMTFLLDRTHDVLACTVEIVLLHVSMDTRRPHPFPDDVVAGLAGWQAAQSSLDWESPVCGAMGLRH